MDQPGIVPHLFLVKKIKQDAQNFTNISIQYTYKVKASIHLIYFSNSPR